MNGIALIISKCDTLRPLSTWFKPFANIVCDTKYQKHLAPSTLYLSLDICLTFYHSVYVCIPVIFNELRNLNVLDL